MPGMFGPAAPVTLSWSSVTSPLAPGALPPLRNTGTAPWNGWGAPRESTKRLGALHGCVALHLGFAPRNRTGVNCAGRASCR